MDEDGAEVYGNYVTYKSNVLRPTIIDLNLTTILSSARQCTVVHSIVTETFTLQ